MNQEYKAFLRHILESIAAIEDYARGLSEEVFLSSPEK